LLDPNFMGNTAMDAVFLGPGKILGQNAGAFATIYLFGHDNAVAMGMTQNPDFWLNPVRNPILNPGDTPQTGYTATMTKYSMGITAACEDVELAARWLDQLFTYEYMMLQTYGVEGFTYYINENGRVRWAEYFTNHPEGLTQEEAAPRYLPINANFGWYNWWADTLEETFTPEMLLVQENYGTDPSDLAIPERITLIDDEVVRFNTIQTTLETIVVEHVINSITGSRSMDEWDSFVSLLYDAGVEEAIAIQQAALDRYNMRGR